MIPGDVEATCRFSTNQVDGAIPPIAPTQAPGSEPHGQPGWRRGVETRQQI